MNSYLKKHHGARKQNGEPIEGVRGVSETDFLWGLAEALEGETSKANLAQSGWNRIRLCVEACLAVLDQIDGREQPKEPRITEPAD